MIVETQDIDEPRWHSPKKEQRTPPPPRKHKRETKSKLSTKLFFVMLWVAFAVLAWYYESTRINIDDHFISTVNSGWEVADKENINAIVIKITDINREQQLLRFAYRIDSGSYLQSDREMSIDSLNRLYERTDVSTFGAKKL